MDHQHRDLAGLIGFEHVQTLQLLGLCRIQQSGGRRVEIAKLLLIESIRQRRG